MTAIGTLIVLTIASVFSAAVPNAQATDMKPGIKVRETFSSDGGTFISCIGSPTYSRYWVQSIAHYGNAMAYGPWEANMGRETSAFLISYPPAYMGYGECPTKF